MKTLAYSVIAAVTLVLITVLHLRRRKWQRLIDAGTDVSGTLERIEPKPGGYSVSVFRLTVSYEAGGQKYTNSRLLTCRMDFSAGQQIPVRFLADDPLFSVVTVNADYRQTPEILRFLIFLTLFAGAAAAVITAAYPSVRTASDLSLAAAALICLIQNFIMEHSLAKHAALCKGTVLQTAKKRGSVTVWSEYSADGSVFTAKPSSLPEADAPYQPGDEIEIRYNAKKPWQGMTAADTSSYKRSIIALILAIPVCIVMAVLSFHF